ncbi:MAG TPA: hypothetical protein PLI50_07770, partial [bacterium]|nr:hypothetical protein [bacterium]
MDKIFNQKDRDAIKTIRIAKRFLQQKKEKQLLEIIGKEINAIPDASYIEKKWFQKSYIIGNQKDDFLTGKGVFYITEGRKLFLDATAGHYQMTFGYNHPFLMKKLNEALEMVRASSLYTVHT